MQLRRSTRVCLELDGADLGAVLLLVASPLRLLIDVELTLDTLGGAMEPRWLTRKGQELIGVAWNQPRPRAFGAAKGGCADGSSRAISPLRRRMFGAGRARQ